MVGREKLESKCFAAPLASPLLDFGVARVEMPVSEHGQDNLGEVGH